MVPEDSGGVRWALQANMCICDGSRPADMHTDKVRYLKVPPLLVDGDDKLIDVRDQLVALSLPQPVRTLLQQLHQHILTKEERPPRSGLRGTRHCTTYRIMLNWKTARRQNSKHAIYKNTNVYVCNKSSLMEPLFLKIIFLIGKEKQREILCLLVHQEATMAQVKMT